MKRKNKIFIPVFALLYSLSLHAQFDTRGMDFWLTFGRNSGKVLSEIDLQIRLVGGNQATTVTVDFTIPTVTDTVINLTPGQVFTYRLVDTSHKTAVYNAGTGISNNSVHITSTQPITAYALNQSLGTTEASNIIPVPALGLDYYQISYMPNILSDSQNNDAYAVIATQNATTVYHNGVSVAMLNTGQVYYYTPPTVSDMTGAHITSDKPIAFFAVNQGPQIPSGVIYVDHLFEQLAPVNTWGKNFFVPVSNRQRDRVRIMASQNGTNITVSNGTIQSVTGGQTALTNLNAGQWVEIEVNLATNGSFIQADKPIAVCTYLTGSDYNSTLPGISNSNYSDPAQAWLPAIEQSIPSALIAPFVPSGTTNLKNYYALIITPTATRNNTTVSIGGAPPAALTGGTWYNHPSGYSFYNMSLTNTTASYLFANDEGLIVMSYGTGEIESYYYLAASAMRNLSAPFDCLASGMILSEGYTSGTYSGTTRFSRLDASDVPMDFTYMFSIPYVINSTGYNPLDNMLYAFPQGNTSNLSGQNVMYRIDALGNVETLAVTPVTPAGSRPQGGGFKGGTIDEDGIYYLSAASADQALYYIDLKVIPYVTQRLSFSGNTNLPDIVWDPVNKNRLYGLESYTGQEGRICVFTVTKNIAGLPTGLTMTRIGDRWSATGTYADASNYSFGGLYMDPSEILYGTLNAGGFYRFDITDGTRTRLANSNGATANDGANCPFAYIQFGADLQITKTDNRDDAPRPGNTTYTVVVSNNGPYPAINAGISDTVPAGIPAGNMSWSVVSTQDAASQADGMGTQTGAVVDTVSIDAGGNVTYSVTINIPDSYQGDSITNTAVVTPNLLITVDPDNTNNSDFDTDVIQMPYLPVNPHIRGKFGN